MGFFLNCCWNSEWLLLKCTGSGSVCVLRTACAKDLCGTQQSLGQLYNSAHVTNIVEPPACSQMCHLCKIVWSGRCRGEPMLCGYFLAFERPIFDAILLLLILCAFKYSQFVADSFSVILCIRQHYHWQHNCWMERQGAAWARITWKDGNEEELTGAAMFPSPHWWGMLHSSYTAVWGIAI